MCTAILSDGTARASELANADFAAWKARAIAGASASAAPTAPACSPPSSEAKPACTSVSERWPFPLTSQLENSLEHSSSGASNFGLGQEPDLERYGHLSSADDFELLRWVVRRASGCFWIKDSPRTRVKGFRHRLITRGPPVRVGLHRLNRPDTEWVEKAIQEDVARGQLTPGSSL